MKEIRVRITNDTGYVAGTKVELVNEAGETFDLTEFGAIHFPIDMQIKDDGAFAILVLELESVNIPTPIRP